MEKFSGSGIGDDGKRKKDEKDEFEAFAQARTASFDASKNRCVVELDMTVR